VNTSKGIVLGLLAAFLIPAIFAIWTDMHETIPPRNITGARMFIIKRRILLYARAHDSLPPDLSALPPMQSQFDSLTVDEWGRPIDYTADPDGIVTLHSLGADKAPGGTGVNADMIAVFSARDSQGGWQDPTVPWNKDPLQ
jgi:hypothetical protein